MRMGTGRDLGTVQIVHYSYFTCEYENPSVELVTRPTLGGKTRTTLLLRRMEWAVDKFGETPYA